MTTASTTDVFPQGAQTIQYDACETFRFLWSTIFGEGPSTPVMALIPTREQGLALPQLIQEGCRDAVGQQFVCGPDMIDHTCRHSRGHGAPRKECTGPSAAPVKFEAE